MAIFPFSQAELLPWYAFATVWAISCLGLKPDKVSDRLPARLINLVGTGSAFLLLFSRAVPVALLNKSFLPKDPRLELVGAVLAWAGVVVAIWARGALGANWSSRVKIKVDHQLVRSGPYRYARHPIYSGVLLAVVGTTLEAGEWRAVVSVLILLVTHGVKAHREEQFMMAEFKDSYAQYRQTTGFLFPKLCSIANPIFGKFNGTQSRTQLRGSRRGVRRDPPRKSETTA